MVPENSQDLKDEDKKKIDDQHDGYGDRSGLFYHYNFAFKSY